MFTGSANIYCSDFTTQVCNLVPLFMELYCNPGSGLFTTVHTVFLKAITMKIASPCSLVFAVSFVSACRVSGRFRGHYMAVL